MVKKKALCFTETPRNAHDPPGRCRLLDDVDLDLRNAFAGDAQRLGGGRRDVDHAAANERAAVVHARIGGPLWGARAL